MYEKTVIWYIHELEYNKIVFTVYPEIFYGALAETGMMSPYSATCEVPGSNLTILVVEVRTIYAFSLSSVAYSFTAMGAENFGKICPQI